MQNDHLINKTQMFKEAAESATAVEHQLAANQAIIVELVSQLRNKPPRVIVTCARGSSDHAASYGKYIFESFIGIITASAAPSVSSIYGAVPDMENALFIGISQSGKSPDLLCQAQSAKGTGALIVIIVNDVASPLADLADVVLPMHAGPEISVAATKSYICSLSALLQLAAVWSGDQALLAGLANLPSQLRLAWQQDWSYAVESLLRANSLFVLGRGYGLGIAMEAALKCKETCGLHAEAFSSAEVKHGPMAIVGDGFPVLVFAQQDKSQQGVDDIADEFLARDAKVILAGEGSPQTWRLPVVAESHPACAPLLLIQSFYRMVNELAVRRGYNPDLPPHLNKVTETI